MVASLFTDLGEWVIRMGYKSAVLQGLGGKHMAPGSENGMIFGEGIVRAFRGMRLVADKIGSRVLVPIDQSYVGLGVEAAVAVQGSVFQVRELLMYCGAGQVTVNGVALDPSISASSTLSYIKRAAGVYVPSPTTGPFQAGRAQPSAPLLYPKDNPSAGQKAMSAAVAAVIVRSSTVDGEPSLASLPSNIVTLTDQSAILQITASADFNGQDVWLIFVPRLGFVDLGLFYGLPTSLGGQVTEASLAYTRAVTGCSIPDASDIVTITDPDVADQLTGADVGRRFAFSTYDSYILEVNSATEAKMADVNDSGGAIAGDGVITHAIDGITRAVEISWTNGDLALQDTAPDFAFPPPAVRFAGVMNDVIWAEGEDSIIYVSQPGFIGSFPPDSAIFAPGAAVLYIRANRRLTIRFEEHNVGAMYYTGADPALEFQTFIEGQGIKYAQNAGLGWNGRLCAWLGQPTIVNDNTLEPDPNYASDVMPEFHGWNDDQTALTPICFGYDPKGKYEAWALKKKVRAKYAPSGEWCSPVDLTGKVTGDIVAAVTFQHALYLACIDGAALNIYEFDAGTGSVLKVRTDEIMGAGLGDTITQVMAQVRCDNLTNKIKLEIIINYDEGTKYLIYDELPTKLGTQQLPSHSMQPNILNVRQHGVLFTIESVGGDVDANGREVECGVDWAKTFGSTSEIV